jgi:pyrroloquinoline-quinone synthase
VTFWDRIEQISEQRNVLRHPFYVRWSEGTLTRDELAYYAGQYRHAVVALADAAAAAARAPEAGADAAVLAAHASDEAAHVALWDEFVTQVGGDVRAPANDETSACAGAWAGNGGRPLLETLVAMYAIESAQPAISATKQAGLKAHYGVDGSRYFELHERLDADHAAGERELIEARLSGADEDALIRAAEQVLDANWLLLDGADRLEL